MISANRLEIKTDSDVVFTVPPMAPKIPVHTGSFVRRQPEVVDSIKEWRPKKLKDDHHQKFTSFTIESSDFSNTKKGVNIEIMIVAKSSNDFTKYYVSINRLLCVHVASVVYGLYWFLCMIRLQVKIIRAFSVSRQLLRLKGFGLFSDMIRFDMDSVLSINLENRLIHEIRVNMCSCVCDECGYFCLPVGILSDSAVGLWRSQSEQLIPGEDINYMFCVVLVHNLLCGTGLYITKQYLYCGVGAIYLMYKFRGLNFKERSNVSFLDQYAAHILIFCEQGVIYGYNNN
ncbi:hypothetical protein KUTeg_021360 [Tegillarca granosa]|uniref:Uncharacterized protein n=1 Tax=Tegillarca granosa TaxID=220873 RepID=A0ABQ9EAJ1_TEGGR|nr:hypothetical protein KUTeg_021360 [Tegillarca granosa]